MIKKSATIIGAGISGLSIGKMLSERYNIQIFEKEDKVGGLLKCDRIKGNLFHKVGGHVFNSKNQEVLNWFWNHFDQETEFLQAKRNAKILFNNKLIGYPIENFIYQLPEENVKSIIDELIDIESSDNNTIKESTNFKDFLISIFGKQLFNLYFEPYNSKLWNFDLSQVPLDWLEGKLPMPKIKEIIINNILRKEESAMVHSTFNYPKRNGSQFIVDRLAEKQNIKSSYFVSKIQLTKESKISINDSDFITDLLIYCGDVRQLFSIIDINDNELQKALFAVKDLPSNGTSNVLCETDSNDISWLYLPEKKYKAHRIIYTGNFSNSNNEGTLRSTCVVEFSGKLEKTVMLNELHDLPGNLNALEYNFEPNSYVIQDEQTRAKIKHLKSLLEKYNVYLLGRFAEWEYYNMDKCVESAMELCKKIN